MWHFIQTSIDTLFPLRVDTRRVRSLTPTAVSDLYRPHPRGEVLALSHFKHPSVSALVHEAKFHGSELAFSHLATLLERFLKTQTKPYVIVPIPLARERERTRGYNQVTEVIERSLTSPHQFSDSVLVRTRNTEPQTSLGRAARQFNVQGAFRVTAPDRITGRHLLLIDDVCTTGATLKAAKAALLQHSPASVSCLAMAH